MKTLAEDREIPFQLEVLRAGGTDTAGFQNTHGATPVGALPIPTRYLHTATETARVDDIDATIELLTALLETERGSTTTRCSRATTSTRCSSLLVPTNDGEPKYSLPSDTNPEA